MFLPGDQEVNFERIGKEQFSNSCSITCGRYGVFCLLPFRCRVKLSESMLTLSFENQPLYLIAPTG